MVFIRNFGKAVKIGFTAYITGGIAYWITAQTYIRYIGKEVTFTPLLSFLLTVPLWPMHVYGDLMWVGFLPQDFFGLLMTILTILLFILDFATRGKYRTRSMALITLAAGLILGIIYVLARAGAEGVR
jgi:hypothetical protein